MIHFVYKAHVMCLSSVFEYFFVFVFAGIVYLRQTKNVVVVFSHVGREQKRPLLKVGALSEGPELVFEYLTQVNICEYQIFKWGLCQRDQSWYLNIHLKKEIFVSITF